MLPSEPQTDEEEPIRNQEREPSTTSNNSEFSVINEILQVEPCNDDSWIAFFKLFASTKGAPQIILVGLIMSFGIGATLAVVPGVVSDRFARTRYGYDGIDCSHFDRVDKPDACVKGGDTAQSASAVAGLAMNLMTLCANSTVGSVSDVRGRKGIMVLCTFLWTLAPFVLVLMQLRPSVDPAWYYVAYAQMGVVNWMSMMFAMLSDLMPRKYRAHGFGFFLSAWYLGISFSPSFARLLDHFWLSVLSLTLLILACLVTIVALPETLPPHVAERNLATQKAEERSHHGHPWLHTVLRPIREAAILNRDFFLRLLTVGLFFSGIVYSSDANLIFYYIEDQLDVRDEDLEKMLLVMGLLGVAIQGFLLQLLVAGLGEKGLLVTSFACGTLHNLLYGLAKSKRTIYIALAVSQLTKMNFPLIPSMASKKVNENEHGRLQGALFAVSALADALGPVSLEWIYNRTENGAVFGPGTMFVFGSFLYGLGTVIVSLVPGTASVDESHSSDSGSDEHCLDEPLLNPQSLG